MFSQHQSATHDGTTLDTRSTPPAHITSLPDEILLLIFSKGLWKDNFEVAVTMLSLAKTCRHLAMLAELSQATYFAWKESPIDGFDHCYGSILRILLRNPGMGRHIQKTTCTFRDSEDNNLEAFTPHDWELARATIHRVCNLDAWNGQCRSQYHSRDMTQIVPSQQIDKIADVQADVALRSDDVLHLEEIQIPSITRGKLETEWVRLLELNDYNARIALFLTLAFGLKEITVDRSDFGEWGFYPDLSTLSPNLVSILLLGAANMQHEQKVLPETSDVFTTPFRHTEATILPRLFEVQIRNDCNGYCNAPMKIATPWLLLPSVKKARITESGNEKISHWPPSQILPWTPVPGLTLGLESLRIVSCSLPAEGLGLLVQSCPSLRSLEFILEEYEGGGIPTSCIHPHDIMPRLRAIAHLLEHLDLTGMLWANGLSHDSITTKDPEGIFVLGHRNGHQTLGNQIDETANASVTDPVENSSVPMKLYMVEASRFNVETRFGSFRAFTKLRSLILKAEHFEGSNAQNLPTELVSILPENLEHLWIRDYEVTENYSLITELERLANMRREGSFARMKSITLGDGYVFKNDGCSKLREVSRICRDVGICLLFDKDDITCYYHDDDEYYPWEKYLF